MKNDCFTWWTGHKEHPLPITSTEARNFLQADFLLNPFANLFLYFEFAPILATCEFMHGLFTVLAGSCSKVNVGFVVHGVFPTKILLK